MSIVVENLDKRFENFVALKNVFLEVHSGGIVAVVGPSGSGKSTLLRLIAGLEKPNRGEVWLAGKELSTLSPPHRSIGFVFQGYALFPHLTVAENIAFGLEVVKVNPVWIRDRVREMLYLTSLRGLGSRYPRQLSGGQRQRVALARAMCLEPAVLLLDEPFAALDSTVRRRLRRWLRRLHQVAPITTVFVTHDLQEAKEVAPRVVVVEKGQVVSTRQMSSFTPTKKEFYFSQTKRL